MARIGVALLAVLLLAGGVMADGGGYGTSRQTR